MDFLIFGTSPLTPLGFFPLFSNKYINLKMCTFGTKFPNIDNWNYISKFRIWYLEMDVHFQKSIFGILVPNGPYKKVLPYFESSGYNFSPKILKIGICHTLTFAIIVCIFLSFRLYSVHLSHYLTNLMTMMY